MYTFYGTSACHLCEHAQAILNNMGVFYQTEDISESDALFERYGLLIPVLRHELGSELNWPFDAAQLRDFMEQTRGQDQAQSESR